MARHEAIIAPDSRIQELTEHSEAGTPRSIRQTSPEAIALLARGHDILYRFDDGGRLHGLPYLEVLEAMRRDVLLSAHKARHGELVDEPEVVPALRQLLAGIDTAVAAFRRACEEAEANT
ncbi:MAG TPA: hypothetical protein VF579_05270 [Candidatus Methylomirabilis sp.]